VDPAEHDEPHQPSPTIGPVGFAIGVVVILVGLIVNPLWISTIGLGITIVILRITWQSWRTVRGHDHHH